MSAISLQRFSHRLYEKKYSLIPRLIGFLIFHLYHCDLPAKVKIGKFSSLGHRGMGVVINQNSVIGNNCVIAQNVTLAGGKGGAPQLSDYIYVGCNSVILGGVKIGSNVTIGALSFVNKDVPENAIVAGSPAQIIRIMSSEEVIKHRRKLDKMHNRCS